MLSQMVQEYKKLYAASASLFLKKEGFINIMLLGRQEINKWCNGSYKLITVMYIPQAEIIFNIKKVDIL